MGHLGAPNQGYCRSDEMYDGQIKYLEKYADLTWAFFKGECWQIVNVEGLKLPCYDVLHKVDQEGQNRIVEAIRTKKQWNFHLSSEVFSS